MIAAKPLTAPSEQAAGGAGRGALEPAGSSELAPLWFVGVVVLAGGFGWAEWRRVARSQRPDAPPSIARWPESPRGSPAHTPRLDVERAGPRELRRLPGIGDQRALALARARWRSGAPAVFGNLDAQPGIGPITAGRVAAWLRAAGPAAPGQVAGVAQPQGSEQRASGIVPSASTGSVLASPRRPPDARGTR